MNLHSPIHQADAATLIADRGGAMPGYANDPAKLLACNKWVDHARPIIKAMFVLEDAADAPLLTALVAAGRGLTSHPATWQERDYREARVQVAKARNALFDMLDGIRDNFIADERAGIGNNDDETAEADDFNDWLGESTISVDAAVQIVTDEHNASFLEKAA